MELQGLRGSPLHTYILSRSTDCVYLCVSDVFRQIGAHNTDSDKLLHSGPLRVPFFRRVALHQNILYVNRDGLIEARGDVHYLLDLFEREKRIDGHFDQSNQCVFNVCPLE